MCGFVLAFAKTERGVPSDAAFAAMDEALRHRGPDERGRKTVGPVMMAHRRLRIIDLVGGQQPLSSPAGDVWLVFNGEIYNFRDLCAELSALGHHLSGRSDTEALLAAYLEWGDSCVERLNGMFAFAIYDARSNRLFAARDRFGEKPMYVFETPETTYIASEANSFLAGQVIDAALDPIALYSYLTCKYPFGARSIFKGVRRLLPGHCLAVDRSGTREWAYWRPPVPCDDFRDEEELVRRTLELLRDAVRLRLVSDVPIGFFLSGGLDSSAIVALASEASNSRLETFGVGFEHPKYDERRHQHFVARRFGTSHHEIVLKPQSIEVLQDLVWHLDEPFADSAALPTWFLAEQTRRYVTVAMSGDGGDELFAGYDVYRGYLVSQRIRRLPGFVRRATANALYGWRSADVSTRARRIRLARNIVDSAIPPRQRFVAKQQTAFRRETLRRLSPALAPLCSEARDEELFSGLFDHRLGDLEAMALWQQTTSLPDDMLYKADRMSMAHSLEVRAPFLDHRIVELVNRAPFDIKLRGGRTKNILKQAMTRYFPADFLNRRKQGFDLPLAAWFKEDLTAFSRAWLLGRSSVMPHLVSRDGIERMLLQHDRLEIDWSDAIWTMLVLELWLYRRGMGARVIDALHCDSSQAPLSADGTGICD